jgi:hypothetical protein
MNIHNSIIELKKDINRLIQIYKTCKNEYSALLIKAQYIPSLVLLIDKVKYLLSFGYIKLPDRRIEIKQKQLIIHKKYLPLLEELKININELINDYKKYSSIDKQYYIQLSVFIRESGYPSNWSELSNRIRERDEYRCKYCSSSDRILHVHHIIPLSKGGSNSFNNLITLCEKCHIAKHPHMR